MRYFTLHEAADQLNLPERVVAKFVDARRVKSIRLNGGQRFVPEDELRTLGRLAAASDGRN